MNVISQLLVVKDWPLQKPGDEMFFGYVVAVGVFPIDWSNEGMFAYADFAYHDHYSRYRLPDDEGLIELLMKFLAGNLEMNGAGLGIYAKVWVKRTMNGYELELP